MHTIALTHPGLSGSGFFFFTRMEPIMTKTNRKTADNDKAARKGAAGQRAAKKSTVKTRRLCGAM
jgi:hypothetical protein